MTFVSSLLGSVDAFLAQELPPGCGPPCPSLAGIFGRDMDEAELKTAKDGAEHLETSQASRRLTALSAASPKELTSHVQVKWRCCVS